MSFRHIIDCPDTEFQKKGRKCGVKRQYTRRNEQLFIEAEKNRTASRSNSAYSFEGGYGPAPPEEEEKIAPI